MFQSDHIIERIIEARHIVEHRHLLPASLVAVAVRTLRQWSPDDLTPRDLPAGVVRFPVRRAVEPEVLPPCA